MMRRIILIVFGGVLFPVLLAGQARQNAVVTSLAGTYTTHSRGVDAVGWNPANLGFPEERPFSWSLVNINGAAHNNAFSIAQYNRFSGANLENENRKTDLLESISSDGWRWTMDMHTSVPGISFSVTNWAFTSDLIVLNDISIPKDLFKFLFTGNTENDSLVFDFSQETLALGMHSFSFGMPFQAFSLGISLKYLNGLYYSGMTYQEGALYTTPEAITGVMHYQEQEAVGGNGVAVDIGVTTREREDWQFGMAINNLGGKMKWGKATPTARFVSGTLSQLLPIDEIARTTNHFYGLDSLNGESLYRKDMSDLVIDSVSVMEGTEQFTVKYPTMFRFGGSYALPDYYLKVMMDFRTGFEDRFFARNRWVWSTALEWRRKPWLPIRTGIAWDGSSFTQWGLGLGFETELLELNLGLSFERGMWIHTLKGMTFSLGMTYRILPD